MYFEFEDARRIHQPYVDDDYQGRSKSYKALQLLVVLEATSVLSNSPNLRFYSQLLETSFQQFAIAELEERTLRLHYCCLHGKFARPI